MGIVMNTIPDIGAHRTTASRSCADVHGGLYDTPTSSNIHNMVGETKKNLEDFWK